MIGSDEAGGLYLHLGAHRTGTSYFQSFLGLNAGRLQDLGVKAVYPGRDGARGGALRLKLPERAALDSGDLDRFEEGFRRQNRRHGFKEARNLLLSEENFPGNMQSHHSDALFPTVRARMEYLRGKVGKPVRRVLYVLRRYDTFYLSSYRKRLELSRMPPFADLRPAVLGMTRGWADILTDIQAGAAAPEIIVARYEALPTGPQLLTALMPWLPADGWIAPEGRVNASLPIADLAAMQNARRAKAGLAPLEQADFSPTFSDAEIQAFTERYEEDLTQVAALPFVRMLG